MSAERSALGSRRTKAVTVTAIFVAALLLRLAAMMALDAYDIEDSWEFGYETGRIASSLAEGGGFSSPFAAPTGPTAWLAPGYPWLLSLVFRLFGIYSGASAIVILILNSLFSAGTCVVGYFLGRRAFGEKTGLWVAILLAVYPPSIWHAINTIWDTSLFALLTLLALLGVYPLLETSQPGRVITWAILVGLGALVNPAILLVVGILWIDLLFRRDVARSQRFRAAIWASVVAVAVVSPWMVRNAIVLGRPVLRSNFGFELHLGNNEEIWQYQQRGEDVAPWFLGHPSVLKRELEKYEEVGEMEYVDEAKQEAWAFIQHNPGKFLQLTLRRVETFWLSDLRNRNDWAGNLDLSASLSWVKTACHVVPLPFAILGMVVALRRRMKVGPLVYFLALFPMLYYVTHVSERYRYPIEPILLAFAVFGLVSLVEAKSRIRSRDTTSPRA